MSGEEAHRAADNPDPSASPDDEGNALPTEPTDRRLVEHLIAGDEEAVRALVQRYDRLIRYAIFKAGRRHCMRDPSWLDARANETWTGIVAALRRRGRAAIPPALPAYFVRIARNKCLDAVAEADAQRTIPIEAALREGAGGEVTGANDDPHVMLENLEQLSVLRDCIARLNEDEQVICSEIGLILDRRWREASDRLDMPESTLRSRWGNILDKLKACLEQKSSKKFRAPGP